MNESKNLPAHSGPPDTQALMADLILQGDLSRLTKDQKVQMYVKTCDSLGLNWLTKPFDFLKLSGREVLYVKKDATDQLRRINRVSVSITSTEKIGDVYVVKAKARTPDGREDESTGAVAIGALKGDALANCFMKAETKAKRRVTLSICGLGWLDESEVSSIAGAEIVPADEMLEPGKVEAPKLTMEPKAQEIPTLSVHEVAALYSFAERYGWTEDDVRGVVKKKGYESALQITDAQAGIFREYITKNPKKVAT